jgi:hypothetical protein
VCQIEITDKAEQVKRRSGRGESGGFAIGQSRPYEPTMTSMGDIIEESAGLHKRVSSAETEETEKGRS